MVNSQRFTFSNSGFLSSAHQTSDRNKRVKEETSDLLRLCHTVPLEVVNLGWLLCVTLLLAFILSERTSKKLQNTVPKSLYELSLNPFMNYPLIPL